MEVSLVNAGFLICVVESVGMTTGRPVCAAALQVIKKITGSSKLIPLFMIAQQV
jgi:hypothetical protein